METERKKNQRKDMRVGGGGEVETRVNSEGKAHR